MASKGSLAVFSQSTSNECFAAQAANPFTLCVLGGPPPIRRVTHDMLLQLQGLNYSMRPTTHSHSGWLKVEVPPHASVRNWKSCYPPLEQRDGVHEVCRCVRDLMHAAFNPPSPFRWYFGSNFFQTWMFNTENFGMKRIHHTSVFELSTEITPIALASVTFHSSPTCSAPY